MSDPNESSLFNALRDQGIDADDREIRAAVRAVFAHVEGVFVRGGPDAARRCMQAMRAALDYRLEHPDRDDMSAFESAFDDSTSDGEG
jgi:hypothetical protein